MKYFTKELWRSSQGSANRNSHLDWQQAFERYAIQLKSLESRLSSDAYRFFAEADVHDGELMELTLKDASRPAPLSEPSRPWQSPETSPVQVRLTVLDGMDKLVWTLSYATVRRTMVEYPGADPLFPGCAPGFGDWGYHELTDAGGGFFRHEILFASGSVLLV